VVLGMQLRRCTAPSTSVDSLPSPRVVPVHYEQTVRITGTAHVGDSGAQVHYEQSVRKRVARPRRPRACGGSRPPTPGRVTQITLATSYDGIEFNERGLTTWWMMWKAYP